MMAALGGAPAAPAGVPAAAAVVGTGPGGDARMLNVQYDARGQRYHDYMDAVLSNGSQAFPDWPVRGPRTTEWCLEHIKKNCGGPMAWHTKWRTEWKVDVNSANCRQHEFLCRVLETAVCYDQVNTSNLACMELLCRQIQLIEEQQYEAMFSGKDKDKGGKMEKDVETSLFFGTQATRGGVCICPALTEWLAKQLQAEAAVSKERRKAREERALRKD